MNPLVQLIYALSLIIFMVGNLSAMGLQLRVSDACIPLKNLSFTIRTMVACFVIGPALACLTVLIVPMERPYALGVLLLGMAPSAPFLPLVVRKAGGDLAAAAGFMLLASLGTIILMPLVVPLLASGLSVSAWNIAKPLIFLVLLPLAVGITIRSIRPSAAERIYDYVKKITSVGTIVFLCLVLILNFKSFIGSVGSHALLAQLLFVPALTLGGYLVSAGMPPAQRSVMSLGSCTRNIGAAAAIVGPDGDRRIMVVLVMATLVTVACSFAVAPWFVRTAQSATDSRKTIARSQIQRRNHPRHNL